MKLRAIQLADVRRFTTPMRLDGIGDGLNLICEANEFGKSTLFDALQALFFKPCGSKDREVMSLRPHAGGAPEVSVEVETGDGRFTVTKRWLSKPQATVTQGSRLVAQADAAEAWIARLLGDGAGGPSGLLWVRQGRGSLAEGSKAEQQAAQSARRDLLSSVAGEVEEMTGGRRMDAALARCRTELADYATGTFRPRTGGPWKAALDRVEALTLRSDDLAATALQLSEALDRRRKARRALAEIDAPEMVAERRAKLDAAEENRAEAARHAEGVEAETRKAEDERLEIRRLASDLALIRDAQEERREASETVAKTAEAAAQSDAREQAAKADLAAAQDALATALATRRATEDVLRAAERQQRGREGAARRAELQKRIERAEQASRAISAAAGPARQGPDAATLRRLEDLASAREAAVAARDAGATRLRLTLAPGAEGSVTLEGAPVTPDIDIAIPGGAELVIATIGRLSIRPGGSSPDGSALEAAEARLRAALDASAAADIGTAREAAAARAAAERTLGEARAALSGLAPDGIEALRAERDAIPELSEAEPGPALPEATAALERAEAQRVAAQTAREVAAERLADSRARAARAGADAVAAADRSRRAETALGKLGASDPAAVAAALDRAKSALADAEARIAQARAEAPDVAAAEAALARARSVYSEAQAETERLRIEIATLDERIARSSGDAVEERLAETAGELTAAEADLARIRREVDVLRRLETALDTARTGARDRYFAPVASELKPLLSLLWPEAELTWGDQTLLPDALIRGAGPESVDILSGGTQEQLALLVRLAFARMLARSGRHAPVILDDALVFTDDDRIERMFDALHRQAGDLQIIVLSCRQRVFRDLGGQRLRLEPVA